MSGISDPAVEAAALGARVIYREDAPPAIDDTEPLLVDPARLLSLNAPDPWASPRMSKRIDAVALHEKGMRRREGRGGLDRRTHRRVLRPARREPDHDGLLRRPAFVRDLVAFVFEVELRFARAQVEAGADYIGMGDAAASLMGPDHYREFVWEAEKKLHCGSCIAWACPCACISAATSRPFWT